MAGSCPSSTECRPYLVEHCQLRSNSVQICPQSMRKLTNLGQTVANVDPSWAEIGRIRQASAKSGRAQHTLDRNRPDLTNGGSMLAETGPSLVKVGHTCWAPIGSLCGSIPKHAHMGPLSDAPPKTPCSPIWAPIESDAGPCRKQRGFGASLASARAPPPPTFPRQASPPRAPTDRWRNDVRLVAPGRRDRCSSESKA